MRYERARTATVVVAATIAATLAAGVSGQATAAAAGRIGPNQHFTAYVNGKTGQSAPVVISMACFGPIQPGQTGHPVSGQTVAVSRGGPGMTGGQTTSIGASFGTVPPGAEATSSGYVDFTYYGTKAIPTSLTLPCSGSSSVNFIPLPTIGPSHGLSVLVRLIGQP
jgi:hypothetical protein